MNVINRTIGLSLVVCMLFMGAIGSVATSFADSAPKWYLNKEYDEGDFVKFRGKIFVAIKEHDSDQSNFPGNEVYWQTYKKGAGYKKDEIPTIKDVEKDKIKEADKENEKVIDKETYKLEPVLENENVYVYYNVKTVGTDGYTAEITVYNKSELEVTDWTLTFTYNDDEEIKDIKYYDIDQDDELVKITPEESKKSILPSKKISFKVNIEAAYNVPTADDKEIEEDKEVEELIKKIILDQIVDPDNYELNITTSNVETGAVLVKIDEPTFDKNIFIPEIKIGNVEKSIDWESESLYTDLIANKEYLIYAESYKIDGILYEPVLESNKIKVESDELEIITIAYKKTNIDEKTGRVLVYVFKPEFETDVFLPEITLESDYEDVSKDINWGEYVYFEDLIAEDIYDVLLEDIVVDDITYKAYSSLDTVKINEKKINYVMIKYLIQE